MGGRGERKKKSVSGALDFRLGSHRAARRSTPMTVRHGSEHGERVGAAGCATGQGRDGRAVEC